MSNKVLALIFLSIALFVSATENKETIIDESENDQNVPHNIKHYESKNFEDAFVDVLSSVGEAATIIEEKFPKLKVKWNDLQEEAIGLRNKSIEWQKIIDEWTIVHAENFTNTDSEATTSLMHHAAEAMRQECDKWLGKVEQWKKSVLKAIGVRDAQEEEEEERKETQREIEFLEHETLDGGNNSYEIKELK